MFLIITAFSKNFETLSISFDFFIINIYLESTGISKIPLFLPSTCITITHFHLEVIFYHMLANKMIC